MSKRFPGRHLSVVRLIGVAIVAGAVVFAGFQGWNWFEDSSSVTTKPWMAGYVDVTATPTYPFERSMSADNENVVLSFIVSDKIQPCTPSWGTFYTMAEADASLDIDRRIARRAQQGGEVIVSFGGQLNQELAVRCTDPDSVRAAYTSVIDRYRLNTIDLDLEGASLTDRASGERRATALAEIQHKRAGSDTPLAIWLTLPVAPTGLTPDGTAAVTQLLSAGVDLAGVNLMTMDFGSSLNKGQSMSAAAIDALQSTHQQLHTLYHRQGVELGSKTLWSKMGATPMIGQNDSRAEVFTLADAQAVNSFAVSAGLGRMSLWSLNRDTTCGSNYPDVKQVSESCSGIDQGDQRFAAVLGASFTADPGIAAGITTTSEPAPGVTDIRDDPASSPYPIWSEHNAYPKNTKVVWHHNVYLAKYWTQGDIPDNPVLQASDTPWQLVGPVLPGETPVPVPTLMPGTYPDWSGTVVYTKGNRVMFDNGAYEAKWWTQGDSPEASLVNPDSSPWQKLTDDQVRKLLGQPTVAASN
ncbi:MAG: carbohydrate-binding protein [Microbacteriaceae bacterium]